MSSLLFLSSEDFGVRTGNQGNLLCSALTRGFSFLLFYSTQCQYCRELIPIFKALAGSVLGVQFGMVNVVKEREVVQMSQQTVAPITFVPYMVFYVGGRPFMRYKGPYDIDKIKQFVLEVAQHVSEQQPFNTEATINKQRPIFDYCIGVPLCGEDNVCYLKEEDAYPSTQSF